MDGFIHAHPVLTVVVFTALICGVFLWAVFDGGSDSQSDDIQQGGDWEWPPREAG